MNAYDATTRHLRVAISDVALSFSLSDAEELHVLLGHAGFQRIEISPRSLDIHLPSPERFVELAVLGAATTIPAFAQLDTAGRSALVETVSRQIQTVTQRYCDGNKLTFPMFTHIAVAYA